MNKPTFLDSHSITIAGKDNVEITLIEEVIIQRASLVPLAYRFYKAKPT